MTDIQPEPPPVQEVHEVPGGEVFFQHETRQIRGRCIIQLLKSNSSKCIMWLSFKSVYDLSYVTPKKNLINHGENHWSDWWFLNV